MSKHGGGESCLSRVRVEWQFDSKSLANFKFYYTEMRGKYRDKGMPLIAHDVPFYSKKADDRYLAKRFKGYKIFSKSRYGFFIEGVTKAFSHRNILFMGKILNTRETTHSLVL